MGTEIHDDNRAGRHLRSGKDGETETFIGSGTSTGIILFFCFGAAGGDRYGADGCGKDWQVRCGVEEIGGDWKGAEVQDRIGEER